MSTKKPANYHSRSPTSRKRISRLFRSIYATLYSVAAYRSFPRSLDTLMPFPSLCNPFFLHYITSSTPFRSHFLNSCGCRGVSDSKLKTLRNRAFLLAMALSIDKMRTPRQIVEFEYPCQIDSAYERD